MNDDFINFVDGLGCEIRSVILIDKSPYHSNTDDSLYEDVDLNDNEFRIDSLLSEGIKIQLDPDKFKDWN